MNNKHWKKLVCIVLAVAMSTVMMFSAFAAETSTTSAPTNTAGRLVPGLKGDITPVENDAQNRQYQVERYTTLYLGEYAISFYFVKILDADGAQIAADFTAATPDGTTRTGTQYDDKGIYYRFCFLGAANPNEITLSLN
jgi:hypothetical protein